MSEPQSVDEYAQHLRKSRQRRALDKLLGYWTRIDVNTVLGYPTPKVVRALVMGIYTVTAVALLKSLID